MDFDPTKATDFPNYYHFFPKYSYTDATVFPQNITVEVNVTDPNGQFGQTYTVTAGSQVGIYAATSMRFHSEAEHTIQGTRYKLELQIYHTLLNSKQSKSKFSSNLFVSVFFDDTDNTSNDLLANITDALTAKTSNVGIDLSYLFDYESNLLPVYSYAGTQTFPPCNPASWFVFPKPIHASTEQIQQFYKLYHDNPDFTGKGNYRTAPAQPAAASGFFAFNLNNQVKPQVLADL